MNKARTQNVAGREGEQPTVPYRTVHIILSHPPAPIFHARYLPSWNVVGAKQFSELETSRRELSELETSRRELSELETSHRELSELETSRRELSELEKSFRIGNTSPRAFRRLIVRHWHPLGCRAKCNMHRRNRHGMTPGLRRLGGRRRKGESNRWDGGTKKPWRSSVNGTIVSVSL